MYNWIIGNAHSMVVTLNDSNLTLNQNAANYFADCRYCLIGLDSNKHKLAIKPVSKADIDSRIIPKDQLHKVSHGKGYAKISNKAVCSMIAQMISKPLIGQKVIAHINEKEQMLEVSLEVIEKKEGAAHE